MTIKSWINKTQLIKVMISGETKWTCGGQRCSSVIHVEFWLLNNKIVVERDMGWGFFFKCIINKLLSIMSY